MPIDQKALLRLGSRDHFGEHAVADWQALLERLGYPPGPSDGVFGLRTELATKDLQRAAGIDVDGIVGPATRAAADRLDQRDTPADDLLHGIDVSAHQGRIDWPRVAAAGIKFCWIKLSEGSTLIDDRFAENWRGARDAGLLASAYHFLTVSSPVETQARAFLDRLPMGSTLPPALDVERGFGGGTPRTAAVLAWLRLVEEGLRARGERYVQPVVYVSPSYAVSYLGGAAALGDYRLWVAHYGVDAPTVPPPWPDWAAWQKAAGRVDGIGVDTDLDVMKASSLDI